MFWGLTCDVSWRMFYMILRRIFILFCWTECSVYLLVLSHLMCSLGLILPYWLYVSTISQLLKVRTWSFLLFLLYFYLFKTVNICFIYFGSPMWGVLIYNCYIFLMNWLFHHYIMTFFLSFYTFWFLVYFVCHKYSSPCLLLVCISRWCLFLSLHFQSACEFKAEASLISGRSLGLFKKIYSASISFD